MAGPKAVKAVKPVVVNVQLHKNGAVHARTTVIATVTAFTAFTGFLQPTAVEEVDFRASPPPAAVDAVDSGKQLFLVFVLGDPFNENPLLPLPCWDESVTKPGHWRTDRRE